MDQTTCTVVAGKYYIIEICTVQKFLCEKHLQLGQHQENLALVEQGRAN